MNSARQNQRSTQANSGIRERLTLANTEKNVPQRFMRLVKMIKDDGVAVFKSGLK